MIKILSHISLSGNNSSSLKHITKESMNSLYIYNHFQRGYKIYSLSAKELKSRIINYLEASRGTKIAKDSLIELQLDKILDFITLKKCNQKNIGIWSNGPKPVLIESGGNYILEYSSIYYILKNLFYGLRDYDKENKKGFEFEDSLCNSLRNEEFDVILDSTIIKSGDTKREIDAGVRIGDKLYLFECKCFERPLNFDIGNLNTINYRTEELEKKLTQADTLIDFITKNTKGDNYDFSWAVEISSYVVSSYTEWIWSKEKRLWTKDPNIPRILSVYEVIKLLKSERFLSK